MVEKLFRRQAIEYSTTRTYGTILIVKPIGLYVVVGVMLFFIVLLSLIATKFKYTRSYITHGVIVNQVEDPYRSSSNDKKHELLLQICVTANIATALKDGMVVLMRYDSYPYSMYGQFDGVIDKVTNYQLPVLVSCVNRFPNAPVQPNTPVKPNEYFYAFIVKPKYQFIKYKDDKYPLYAGMTVNATVLLESTTLFNLLTFDR